MAPNQRPAFAPRPSQQSPRQPLLQQHQPFPSTASSFSMRHSTSSSSLFGPNDSARISFIPRGSRGIDGQNQPPSLDRRFGRDQILTESPGSSSGQSPRQGIFPNSPARTHPYSTGTWAGGGAGTGTGSGPVPGPDSGIKGSQGRPRAVTVHDPALFTESTSDLNSLYTIDNTPAATYDSSDQEEDYSYFGRAGEDYMLKRRRAHLTTMLCWLDAAVLCIFTLLAGLRYSDEGASIPSPWSWDWSGTAWLLEVTSATRILVMLFTVRYSHGNYNATVIFVCMAITLLTIFEVNTTIQHHISISVALIGQYITSIAFTQVHWITYSAHTPMSATLDYSYDPLLSESITFSRESRYFGTSNLQRNTTLRRGTSYGTMGAVQELDEGQENEDDEDDDQEAFIKVNVDMKAVRQQRAPYLFMRERIGEDAAETSTQGNDADDGDDEEDDQDMEALLAFQDARRQQVYAFSPTASSAVIPARSMLSPQALPSDSSAANRTPLSWAFQPKDSYSSSYDMRMAAAGSGIAAIGNGPAGGQTVGYPARKRVNRSNLKNNAIGRRTWTGGHSIIYSGIFLESSGDESESVEKEDDEGGNTSEDSFDEKDDPSLLKSDTEDSKLDEESKDPGMQPKPRVLNPEEIPAQGGIPTESQSSDATIATTTDPWVGSDSNEPSECNAQHHQLEKEVVTETHEERQRLKETKRRTIIREYGILGTDGATVKDNTAVIEGDMIVVLDTTTAGVESGEQNIKVEVIDVDVNGECTPSSPGISKEDPKKPTVQAICTDDSFTHTGSSIKENGSQGHRSEKNDATGHREPQEIDHETQLDGHHGLSTVTFNVSSSKQITAVICEDENCEDHPFQEGPAAELESVLGPGITKGNVVHLDIKESSTSAMERTGDGINDFEDESDSGTVQPQPRRRHDELPGIDTIPVECERIRSELEKTHEESQGDGPGSRGIRIRGRTEKTTMELETDKPFDPNDPSSLLIGPGAVLKPGEPHREITTTEEGVDEEGGYRRIHIKERIEKITVEEECSGSSSDSDSDHDHIVPIVATRLGRRNSGGVIVPGGVIIVDERPLPPLPVVQPVPGGRVEGDPDRRPGVVTWGVVSDYPENFIQPGSEPLVLGPPYGAVRRPLYPVAVSPGPDIMIADPRVTLTDPRMIIPEPMVVIPQPIVAISEPTVYIPNPTVAIPESTIAIPEPMIVIPQPRIAPPVPQLQPRRVPVAPPSQPVFQPPPPRVLPPPPPRVLPPPQPAIIPPQRPIVHPPPLPTLVPPVIQHPPLPVVAPPVQPVVPPVRGIVGPGPPIVQGSRGIAVANTHPLVGHGPVPAVVPGYGGYGGHGGHGGYGGYGAYGHGAYGPGAPSDIVSIDGRYSVASIYEDEAYSVASVYDDRSIASIEGRGFVPAPAHGNMMMGGPMYNTGPYMPRGQYGPYGHPQMVTAGHVTRSREHQEEYQDQRGYSNQERGQDAFHHNRHISRESDSMEGTMSTEGLPLYDDREHQNHDRLVRVQHMDRSSDMDGSDILSEDFVNSRPVSDNYSEATSQEIPYQEAVVNDGQLEMKEMAIETYYDTTKSQFKTREKKEQLLTEMAMRIKSIQTDQRQNDEQQQQRQLQFGEGRALGDSLTQGSVASHSTASSMIFSQSPVSTLSLSLQTRNLQQSPPVFTIPKPPTNPPPVRLLANRNVAATLGSSPTPVLERSPIGGRRTAITPTTTRVDNADTANVVKAISLLSNSAEMVAARDRNTEEPILSSSSTNVETILMQARRPKDDDPSISSANGHALKPQMETTTPKPRQLISHSTMMNGASADNEVGVSTRTSTAAAIQRLKERQDALNAAMMSHIIASKAPKKTRRRPHYPPMSREQLHPSLLNEGILACWNNEFGSALEIFNEHSATYPRWSLAAAEVHIVRQLISGQQTEADSDLIEALQQAEKVSSKVLDRKTEFESSYVNYRTICSTDASLATANDSTLRQNYKWDCDMAFYDILLYRSILQLTSTSDAKGTFSDIKGGYQLRRAWKGYQRIKQEIETAKERWKKLEALAKAHGDGIRDIVLPSSNPTDEPSGTKDKKRPQPLAKTTTMPVPIPLGSPTARNQKFGASSKHASPLSTSQSNDGSRWSLFGRRASLNQTSAPSSPAEGIENRSQDKDDKTKTTSWFLPHSPSSAAGKGLASTIRERAKATEEIKTAVKVLDDVEDYMLYGIGLFYFIVSIVPKSQLPALKAIGLQSNHDQGIKNLEGIFKRKNGRAQYAALFLLINYLFLPRGLDDPSITLGRAGAILEECLKASPNSSSFLLMACHHARKTGNMIPSALNHITRGIQTCEAAGVPSINYRFELGLTFFIHQEFGKATDIFEILWRRYVELSPEKSWSNGGRRRKGRSSSVGQMPLQTTTLGVTTPGEESGGVGRIDELGDEEDDFELAPFCGLCLIACKSAIRLGQEGYFGYGRDGFGSRPVLAGSNNSSSTNLAWGSMEGIFRMSAPGSSAPISQQQNIPKGQDNDLLMAAQEVLAMMVPPDQFATLKSVASSSGGSIFEHVKGSSSQSTRATREGSIGEPGGITAGQIPVAPVQSKLNRFNKFAWNQCQKSLQKGHITPFLPLVILYLRRDVAYMKPVLLRKFRTLMESIWKTVQHDADPDTQAIYLLLSAVVHRQLLPDDSTFAYTALTDCLLLESLIETEMWVIPFCHFELGELLYKKLNLPQAALEQFQWVIKGPAKEVQPTTSIFSASGIASSVSGSGMAPRAGGGANNGFNPRLSVYGGGFPSESVSNLVESVAAAAAAAAATSGVSSDPDLEGHFHFKSTSSAHHRLSQIFLNGLGGSGASPTTILPVAPPNPMTFYNSRYKKFEFSQALRQRSVICVDQIQRATTSASTPTTDSSGSMNMQATAEAAKEGNGSTTATKTSTDAAATVSINRRSTVKPEPSIYSRPYVVPEPDPTVLVNHASTLQESPHAHDGSVNIQAAFPQDTVMNDPLDGSLKRSSSIMLDQKNSTRGGIVTGTHHREEVRKSARLSSSAMTDPLNDPSRGVEGQRPLSPSSTYGLSRREESMVVQIEDETDQQLETTSGARGGEISRQGAMIGSTSALEKGADHRVMIPEEQVEGPESLGGTIPTQYRTLPPGSMVLNDKGAKQESNTSSASQSAFNPGWNTITLPNILSDAQRKRGSIQ